MEIIKNTKSSLNGEGNRELETKLQNELGVLKMRIHFAQEDINFFTTCIKNHEKKIKKLGKSK